MNTVPDQSCSFR